jgi:hypothetical protein
MSELVIGFLRGNKNTGSKGNYSFRMVFLNFRRKKPPSKCVLPIIYRGKIPLIYRENSIQDRIISDPNIRLCTRINSSYFLKIQYMCVFKNYILLQDELRELQKVTIQVNKNYNNELRLFQSANIIDSYNAERVKQKFDELMKTNEKIAAKESELKNTEKEIQDYLHAMNGMAIRYAHDHQGISMPMIFELGVNTYGETEIKMSREA